MSSIQKPSFATLVQQLKTSATIAATDVNTVIDAAMRNGTLSRTERHELNQVLECNTFVDVDSKRQLQVFLAIPDARLATLANKLERDDGIIDLCDAKTLSILMQQVGLEPEPQKVTLRALLIGSKLSPEAREHLQALDSPLPTAAPRRAQRIDAAQRRLDAKPLRVFDLTGPNGPQLVDKDSIRPAPGSATGQFSDVDGHSLERALSQASSARQVRLSSGAQVPNLPRVCPEDGSLQIRNVHMALLGSDQTGAQFPRQMADIGKTEGFNVVLRCPVNSTEHLRQSFQNDGFANVTLVGTTGKGDFWSEDQGEFDVDGNVHVPAQVLDKDALYLSTYIERVKRLYPDANLEGLSLEEVKGKIRADFPEAAFSVVGAVAARDSHEAVATLAVAKNSELYANNSHIEGGNLLTGTLANGEGYALVGKDSIAASRHVLELDLGRPVDDDEVRAFIATDLGLQPANVFGVEQPGDFHIDMWMTPIAPGEVLLNDAQQAAELLLNWRREDYEKSKPKEPKPGASAEELDDYQFDLRLWKSSGEANVETETAIRSKATRRASYEQAVVADLEAAGLKVHRMAAVFETGHLMNMNFINGEQGCNSNGERFYVSLGGDARAENYVANHLAQLGSGLKRIYFLDRNITSTTLEAKGGISCRVKSEGRLV